MTTKTPNGLQQVEAMRKLCNPSQKAPASAAWTPDELGGYRVGDHVTLPNIATTFRVIGFQHPSLLILKAPSGRELKAGWQAVTKVRTRAEIEGQS